MKKQKGDFLNDKEVILTGVPASPGIAMGPGLLYNQPAWEPESFPISSKEIPEQIKCFRRSIKKVHAQLKKNYEKSYDQYGKDLAEILEIQIALLEDKFFLKEIEEVIENDKYDAAYATFLVFRQKKEYFLQMSNDYFRDRAFDIQALKEMIVKAIQGKKYSFTLKKPAIVIADNLSPNDTVQFHQQKLLGMATNTGGKNSHTAIVARSLGVPAVVGLKKITEVANVGSTIILDGTHGKVILNPTAETIKYYQKQQRLFSAHEKSLLEESILETTTKDGKQIHVHANIEFENEMSNVLKVGAEGIGLFRTEGIFLNRTDLPSEEEQTEIYTRIAKKVYPRKLVIRTLDIGGDKMLPGIKTAKEENPFLGWRAIRFWLDHKIGFLTQVKAILRANVKGNVKILLPMVSGLGEVRRVKELLREAKEALKHDENTFRENIELGIMVEIPSVVVLADILAREVDFFSIGTNDLVQYTLAVDRGNDKVANLYSHFHPSILRLIKMTIEEGKKVNIPVEMCGEMAGDPAAVPILLAMGLEHLSASPSMIPEIKKIIRELSLSECHDLYCQVAQLPTAREIIETVQKFYQEKFPDLYVEK